MGKSAIPIIAAYVATAWLVRRLSLGPRLEQALLAILGVTTTYLAMFRGHPNGTDSFLACVAFVVFFHYCLRCYLAEPDAHIFYGVALIVPILFLVLFKSGMFGAIAGFSYLTFRLCYLAYEVDAGKTTAPDLLGYLGFAFFPPTFLIGPINPHSYYQPSLEKFDRQVTPLVRSLERVLSGLLKCYLVAPLFKTMDVSTLLLNGYFHGWADLCIGAACTYLFLYFNFSGACDVAIGAAGVLGIHVKENVDNPLAARNLKDFWNRMHITLSHLLRDILFLPGVLYLSRMVEPRRMPLAVLAMTFLTFFLVGLWHGLALNFVATGFLHGAGMAGFYLFTLAFDRFPARVRGWASLWPWRIASTALTFGYVSLTCIFFAADWNQLRELLGVLTLF